MDNTEELTEFTTIEFCAGYAGIQLGLRRVVKGLRTIAYGEIEAFACANLVAKMEAGLLDAAPIWTDIKTFPARQFHGLVDCLIAGYPCPPFSVAGRRRGVDDERHLWPYIREAINIIQPGFCFFENVEGHISLGLSTVLSDLAEDGYCSAWGIFSAEEVGSPHRRKRVFIMAYRNSTGLERLRKCSAAQGWDEQAGYTGSRYKVWPARPGQPQYKWEPPRVVGDTEHNGHAAAENRRGFSEKQEKRGVQELTGGCEQAGELADTQSQQAGGVCKPDTQSNIIANGRKYTTENVLQRDGVWQAQSTLGGNFNECANRLGDAELYESCDNRTDELRLLGNGVVPATVAVAWETLSKELIERKENR